MSAGRSMGGGVAPPLSTTAAAALARCIRQRELLAIAFKSAEGRNVQWYEPVIYCSTTWHYGKCTDTVGVYVLIKTSRDQQQKLQALDIEGMAKQPVASFPHTLWQDVMETTGEIQKEQEKPKKKLKLVWVGRLLYLDGKNCVGEVRTGESHYHAIGYTRDAHRHHIGQDINEMLAKEMVKSWAEEEYGR